MSLEGRQGAYVSLGVKILSYLLLQHVCRSVRLTFHQTQLACTFRTTADVVYAQSAFS